MFQDECEQIRKLCSLWWDTRDLEKDQSLFKPGGEMYKKGSYNAARCWRWQIEQFLNTEFEYITDNNEKKTFRPINLHEELKERLIRQLAVDIGLFHRDFNWMYKNIEMVNQHDLKK